MSCFSIVSLLSSFLHRSAKAAGLSSQTVEIDGGATTIHFWGPSTTDTSKPKLLLIHGFGPPSLWQWHSQISFFVTKFDVYIPDLLFFGNSFTNSSDRSELFQATCLVKLLEKLGVHKYSVVGTSYGGFVAYHMAVKWAERVEKVVIASSAVNLRRSDNDRLLKEAKVDKIEDVLMPKTAARLRKLLGLVLFRPPCYVPDCLLNDILQKLISENMEEKLELLNELSIGKEEPINISALSQETLIVWGEQDQIFLLEKAVELNKLLGDKARLEVIKKASHVPQSERADQFNNILKDFFCSS